jgi:putative acetyltransferase
LSLVIALESPRQDGVTRLLDMSDTNAQSLYPAQSNHFLDLASLEGRSVHFLVARLDDDIVGCSALVEAADVTAEIERMFVDPRVRGRKIARRLMEAIEAIAKEKKLRAIRLETGVYQPEAIGLCRAFSYVEIGPLGSYKPDPLSLFMEKRL